MNLKQLNEQPNGVGFFCLFFFPPLFFLLPSDIILHTGQAMRAMMSVVQEGAVIAVVGTGAGAAVQTEFTAEVVLAAGAVVVQ